MAEPETSLPRLRPVSAASLPAALADALSGGPPVAPVPDSPPERRLTEDMLGLDEGVVEPDIAAVVATSGSTGRPKGVLLSRAAIGASVAAAHTRLGGPGDWVLALPSHYVAGLMVVARTLLAGTALHPVAADLSGLPAVMPRLAGRRYLSLVPTQLWRACHDAALSAALAQFDAVLLGGAAVEEHLLAEARSRGIPVVTTYGMSETCGGCVYDGVPLERVDVDVEPGSGRISLAGPMLFSGYRRRPDLTDAALPDGRLLTADRGLWQHGRLHVLGRVDDVVISGGVNVDLAAVERAARAWPALNGADIVVLGVSDPEWGTAVVAITDGDVSAEGLRGYLRPLMSASALPRDVIRLTALPSTSSGKIDRQRLARLAAAHMMRAPRTRAHRTAQMATTQLTKGTEPG